jgi:hypothetical protein
MQDVIKTTKNSTYAIKLHSVLRRGLNRYIVIRLYDSLFCTEQDSKETIFKLCGADFGGRIVHQIGSVMVVDVYQDTILGGS